MTESALTTRMFAPFGHLIDFRGRTRPGEFWPFVLLLAAIYFVALFACVIVMMRPRVGSPMPFIAGLVLVFVLLASAATVRRLHDVDWSGWWMTAYLFGTACFIAIFLYARFSFLAGGEPFLFRLMPILMPLALVQNVLGLLLLVVCILDGTPGPNRFGPDPKGRSAPG